MSKSVFSDEYNQFRKMLIDARKVANLTQAELSAKLKRPQSYVSKYERGERRLDVIEFLELAQVLEIDPLTFIENLLTYTKGR
ncbi:MAG: multiprotein-bridging factor 1 family protein [Sphaerospermopsis kisseleviana]